jgi:hypothetical protein
MSVRSIFEHPLIAELAQEVEKTKAAGLKARMPPLIRRPPLSPKDALISQLDQLSPEEIRALLDNVIARRPSAAGA